MSTQTRSLLTRAAAAFTTASAGNGNPVGGFGFTCCGLTGGPWPTQGEAECLADIHDHLQHGRHTGPRIAQIVPAKDLLPRAHVTHSPSGVEITALSGLSVGGGQS